MSLYSQLLIDSFWRDSSEGEYFTVINAANEQVVGNVASGTFADAIAAVDDNLGISDRTLKGTRHAHRCPSAFLAVRT